MPIAVWDAREGAWLRDRQEKEDWLKAHGLWGIHTYRIEFFLVDAPFARIFCYHLNAEGRRHWNESHVPGPHDHDDCGPATEPPRMVVLTELPPRDLLGIPA